MKIALVDMPNFSYFENKSKFPSLSLGYLSGILCKEGHEVLIFDNPKWLQSFEETYKGLLAFKPQLIGFTSFTENRFTSISMIKSIKRDSGAIIIVGGSHFSFIADDALSNIPEIDIVVRREGELTILDIIDYVNEKKELSDIDGITYRSKNNEIISNKDRDFISDLDSIPMPKWELFSLDLYQARLIGTKNKTIGIISGRGCPHKCSFCSNAAFGRSTLRLRNYKSVVDEIVYLKSRFGYSAFKFSDDTITINKTHIINLCEEILRRNLNINWSARVRIDTIDEERITLMKKAGCVSLLFGAESGSTRILKKINKRQTPDEIRAAIKLTADIGFPLISVGFMVSLPYETVDDLKDTFSLMKEIKSFSRNIEVTYGFTQIFPGTELESIALKEDLLPKKFSWNTYMEFPKYLVTNTHPTIPYFENKYLPLEKIKSLIIKNNIFSYSFKDLIRFLKRFKNLTQFKVLLRFLSQLFKNNEYCKNKF